MTQNPNYPCILCGYIKQDTPNNDMDYICDHCKSIYSATVKHAYALIKGQEVPIGTVFQHIDGIKQVILLDFVPLTPKIIVKP